MCDTVPRAKGGLQDPRQAVWIFFRQIVLPAIIRAEHGFTRRVVVLFGAAIIFIATSQNLHAGGSGLNTVVIVNQNSSNSCELANYFCERRNVPPENVLRIAWPGSNVSWSQGEFQTNLLVPLLAMLSDRQLTNQIDYVVLSMDIPFQVIEGTFVNSTTSALFYGFKIDTGVEAKAMTNSYFASEQIFRQAHPSVAPGYSFLAAMITSDSLANAKALVDNGVASDGTFPTQPVILAKSSDQLRNIRYPYFDNTIFNTRVRGDYQVIRTNYESPVGLPLMLGFQTGLPNFAISPNSFVPGAMADSLTSFGGVIFDSYGQTTLLAFINAGAAGSYGTVTEPSPDLEKFPDPQNYFYQSRGFTIAECYYQSLYVPYEGLVVAEPLAAPFTSAGAGDWVGIASNTVLAGTTSLRLQFSAASSDRPLQQVDLFVDGKFLRTITNVPPAAGNVLTLRFNNSLVNYTVPAGSSVASVAAGLNSLLSAVGATNSARFAPILAGDRIEILLLASSRPLPPGNFRGPVSAGSNAPGTPTPLFASGSRGTAGTQTTFVTPSRQVYLDSSAFGFMAYTFNGSLQIGSWLQMTVTKTNSVQVSIGVTNQTFGARLSDLITQLTNAVNSSPDLSGSDGVVLEDPVDGPFSSVLLSAKARSPGYAAARARVSFGSSGPGFSPANETNLTGNLSDLQPRNHLYITAGATNLPVTFSLDTRTLEDGYHDLTGVAYEGSHVRTQTRASIPVQVRNTPLSATMILLDLTNGATARASYHIQVNSSTNNTSEIRLFTTGGQVGLVTNQTTARFTVDGTILGAGLHPFYATIKTAAGNRYRTQIQRVRLGP